MGVGRAAAASKQIGIGGLWEQISSLRNELGAIRGLENFERYVGAFCLDRHADEGTNACAHECPIGPHPISSILDQNALAALLSC